ncbi:hypothetical protein N0V82_009347 [Gnomoniopsis sp. IMI 355080]|nr:hypothetical protein N0V82_009347 [Gnomoniopsis sp. IMI 355080]
MEPTSATKGGHNLVKVCIIDTGISPKDKCSKKVKGFKDFVIPDNRQLCDETWHGTQCASIVLSIYEPCELYVARVFRTDEATDEMGSILVAQAIRWAIDPEQNVDIINISAGFQHHCPDLRKAVQEASCKDKLIFAAAGNWANEGPVAFPARYKQHTMCIFSTTVHSQNSQYNPERNPLSHNFAFLGEDWQHRAKADERMSGTSMATAAASGLAALILDFSRHADNQTIWRVEEVNTLSGMTAIFKSMARPAGNLKYVDPKKLLPMGYRLMSDAAVRDHIRARVTAAMEDVE